MMESSTLARPIIIVGCQRSGTTLLRTILGQHPQLLEHPKEPQFILEIYQRFGYEVRDVGTAVAYLLKHPYLPETINPEALHQAFAPYKQLSLSAFFQIYLQIWAGERCQNKRPILKDPTLVYHLNVVKKLFPQATILHVVRDPRGSVSSQKNRWQYYTTWECTMLWKRAMQATSHCQKIQAAPLLEICYERVLLNAQDELSTLCRSLGILFLPEMLTFEEKTTDYTPDGVPLKVTFKSVDSSRLEQWRKRLAPVDICLIEYVCKLEMERWDYRLVQPKVAPTQLYKQMICERLYYFYRTNGRFFKNLLRKIGWRMGIGLLRVPPK